MRYYNMIMWQVIGQDRVVDSLKRSVAEGRLSHAYLFIGPKHVGKMTLAINLAQGLNCLSEESPCGECGICRRIATGNHPDVQTICRIEAEGAGDSPQRKGISIEQIRTIQRSVCLKPYEGSYRVIIIDDAKDMSDEAANALLKTLEEPPPSTIFILLTTDENLLLQTILSRCHRVELKPMPTHKTREVLTSRGASPDQADLLARLSHGCLGWAIAAMNDDTITQERSQSLSRLTKLFSSDIAERFAVAADLSNKFKNNKAEVWKLLELWQEWWRDILLVNAGCDEFATNIDQQEMLRQHAASCDLRSTCEILKSIQETMQQLEANANPRLALEVLILKLPFEREASYA